MGIKHATQAQMFAKSMHKSRRLPIIGAADRVRRPKRPSPENPLIISASELGTFLRCRVKWSWRYLNGIQPIRKAIPLIMGGVGHQILGGWYSLRSKHRTVKNMKRVARMILKETDPNELEKKDADLLYAMCVGYAQWARPRDRELRFGRVTSELSFVLPLVPDRSILIRGYIDAAFKVRSLEGTLGALEHKFKKSITMDMIDLNLQIAVYLWAMRQLFPKYKRYIVYYQVLRKQMPGPRVKADLFAREAVERMDEEIDQWEMDTQRALIDMLDAAIYPNPMDSCSWDCDYQTPCMLRGRPDDLQHVLSSQYRRK